MKRIYIYGASGHGLVISDIAKACGYKDIIFLDDGDNKYLTFDEVKKNHSIPIAFGIGNNTIRKKLFEKVKKHRFSIATLIHPSAIVSTSSNIGEGTILMPNVTVNTKSNIGKGVILNTSSVIEHENTIENFVHISPSVSLAGNVIVKKNTHIGINVTVIQGITIGENCIIGAGSVIIKDIKNNTLCYGNPCKVIKEIKCQEL